MRVPNVFETTFCLGLDFVRSEFDRDLIRPTWRKECEAWLEMMFGGDGSAFYGDPSNKRPADLPFNAKVKVTAIWVDGDEANGESGFWDIERVEYIGKPELPYLTWTGEEFYSHLGQAGIDQLRSDAELAHLETSMNALCEREPVGEMELQLA